MNRYRSYRRATIILAAFVLAALTGIHLLHTSAQTEKIETPANQNLTNGRLVFIRQVTQQGQERYVETSDADGSNRFTFNTQDLSNFATEPTWSPDGTKIAFVLGIGTLDIWVGNANGTGLVEITNTDSTIAESNPTWSVTGKIAYERRLTSSGTPQIWTMNPDGTVQTQFSAITQPAPTGPVWSPDGLKLAFASGGEIWVINANGSNEHRLTMNATADADPAWSPEGSKIVFSRGTSGLATINADGTNETPLTTANDTLPAWSPDGTKIAFKHSASPFGIYTMDADGGNQVNVIPNSTAPFPAASISYEHPAWQPVPQVPNTFSISGRLTHNGLPVIGATVNLSGTTKAATTTDVLGNFQFSALPQNGSYAVSPSFLRHYFTPANRSFNNLTSNQSGNFEVLAVCHFGNCTKNGKIGFPRSSEIFVINPDGTGETNITTHPATEGEPNFAPDGSVIFTSNRDGNTEIYRKNVLDDPNPVNLTNNPASDLNPAYSFDGKFIVFSTNRDGGFEIYRMNADGSNPVRLTNNSDTDSAPAISPDGQKIIFVKLLPTFPPGQNRIFVMNADGSDPHQLSNLAGIPASFERLSYSPDGSKIIFTYSPDRQSNVPGTWTMNSDGTNATGGSGAPWGSYSPDGLKTTYTCCSLDFNNSSRLYYSDASGSRTVTPTTNGNSLPDWQPIAAPRPAVFDFDGDGRSDQAIFRPSTNDWWYLSSINSAQLAFNWGTPTDLLAPADYDGDLKTDLAAWRPSTGDFHILNSFNSTVRIENFGLAGDIPTGGDFDGDGKADLAVYRPGGAQGTFYYRASMGNPTGNITVVNWGLAGDKPVVGDYDGDGRTDTAVYRPSNGTWYANQSSNGQLFAVNFGLSDDRAVPADYDGDGKTDPAVYRNGIWYQLRSAQGFAAFQFGIAGDSPAPADYDGDGRADAAIFRSGVWWMLKSQTGSAEAIQFGLASDTPVLSAYVR